MSTTPSAQAASAEEPPEDDRLLSELEQVIAWRVIGLLDLGFTLDHALEMRNRPDVCHDADDLLKRGYPHSLVVAELT